MIRRRTQDKGVASSNPAPVTIKTPLMKKAMGSHPIKSTSLGKELRNLSLVAATLEIEYAAQIFCNEVYAVIIERNF